MNVRRIEEADIAAVVDLIQRNWDEVLSEHHSAHVVARFRGEVTPDSMRQQMSWKEIYVVEADGAIAATGALANFGVGDAPKYSISNFFVRPELHGKGIGSALMNCLFESARRAGGAVLHVPSSRNAIGFYERFGFIQDVLQPDAADEITWMRMRLVEDAEQEPSSRRAGKTRG